MRTSFIKASIVFCFCFACLNFNLQAQQTDTTKYTDELVFAEPAASYFILASREIVSIDSLGNTSVVGKKLNKKFWSEGGFIIELNGKEYAVDSHGFIWSREGQFLTTVGNHTPK